MNRLLALLFATFIFSPSFCAENIDFTIEATPNWKKLVELQSEGVDFSQAGETSYLLIDWQENEAIAEYCYRFCIRMNNENGVQNNSQLYFSFDPSYQQLSLNKIILHRGNETINQLKRSQVELMRNEKSADRLIYDGTYSALVILNDVRVGDILEYEYTLKGKNPIWGHHFYANHQLAYNEKIIHLYKSSVFAENQSEHCQLIGNAPKPLITVAGGNKRYEWDLKNIEPIFTDGSVPSWYQAYPFCEISSFNNWEEVKRWENELFDFQIKTPLIDAFLSEKKFSRTEEDILKIIRFVQDDVRYLGMEMGTYSHKPHHPEKIFKQRFGDCKDKSYLLAVMLRKCGIEAWPALVNTSDLDHVDELIPSPFVFNHVIVKFVWNDKTYWLDPTISQQKGSLEYLCFPPYGKALVIDQKTGFEKIPTENKDRVVIQEHYWIADSVKDASYQVITNYYGSLANAKRSSFQNNSLTELKDNFVNFYSNYLSGIRWENDSSLKTYDFADVNTFKITEDYIVKDLWKKRDDKELYATFHPFNMYEYLSYSKDQDRTMPLYIYHPVKIDQTISVHLPKYKEISLKDECDSVVNDAIRFVVQTNVDNQNHIYRIKFSYETRAGFVPVDQLTVYFKDYDRLSELCEANIKWGNGVVGFRLFPPALFALLVFTALFVFGLRFLYQDEMGNKPALQKPIAHGGWLIIPAIGLHLTPLIIISQLFQVNYFNKGLWENLKILSGGNPFWMEIALYFELLFNVGIIIFSVFLLILFYQKRVTFPKLYIWFRIVVVVCLLFDLTVIADMFGTETDYSKIASEVINAAIWIPYFYVSQRVKDTFVQTYGLLKVDQFENSIPGAIEDLTEKQAIDDENKPIG